MTKSNNSLKFIRHTKLPIILQDEMAECGHACIVMISLFFGHALDLYGLRKINKPSAEGITMRQINQLLERLKFKTRALRVPMNELHFIKTPAILHWNMNHFVVLKKVKKNKIIIHDPAFGVRTCSIDEFSNSFTGFVLEVEKSMNYTGTTINVSRPVVQFDLSDISSSIVNGTIPTNAKYYLNMYDAGSTGLTVSQSLYGYPVSQS